MERTIERSQHLYKKIALSTLAIIMAIFLTACGKQSSPEKTVDSLFKSAKTLDFDTMETLVDSETKEELEDDAMDVAGTVVDTEEERDIDYDEIKGTDDLVKNLKDLQSSLNHKIVDVEELEDTAIVSVEAEFTDGQELISDFISDFFGEMMGQAFTGAEELTEEESASQAIEIFNKNYSVFEKELTSDQFDIHLIKDEDNDWVVSDVDYALINTLSFNTLNGIENIFAGIMGNFEESFDDSFHYDIDEDVESTDEY